MNGTVRLFRNRAVIYLALCCATASICIAQSNLTSGDGYARREGNQWVMGTSLVEKKVRLEDGQFSAISLRNKKSGREFLSSGATFPEIQFVSDGKSVSATPWRWELGDERAVRGTEGEIELTISLSSATLNVTKHYVVYPGSAVIREWLTIVNSSGKAIRITDVRFWQTYAATQKDFQFNYITGGGNYNGSQLLKTQPMGPAFQRSIDSNSGEQLLAYSGFLPLMFLSNASEGLAFGWDYMGHWRFDIANRAGGLTAMQLQLAGYEKDLSSGRKVETPKAFTAPFSGGVDELGNQMLDWQYAYLWDFTNPDYFAKTRWAVDWPEPWVGDGGTPSADNWGRRLALDLRYVDLLRETGTDILWDDAGWYDKWGTWNAPDWKSTNDYVRKHDMRWVLWYPTFLATTKSKVAQQHPDWIISGQDTLEQSIPATVDWQNKLLDDSVSAWGDYQWRYDIAPAASANDTDSLDADQNFRKVLQGFKTNHPQSGIDACDGGGRWISYDIARFAESGEYTDGGVGPYSVYYTSLLISPDKLHNVVDFDHTYYVPSTDRSHLAMNPTWYRDPGDGPDVEAIRKDWELYHYLVAQGVAGRWSHVFRPRVDHDDPVWYFQRMNRDSSKGVILTKHEKHGTIYYLTSRLTKPAAGEPDHYRGYPGSMNSVTTTSAATISNAIYQDTVDGALRYYGVPGQQFGPLNVKYGDRNQSLVTKIEKLGANRVVADRSFGMALELDQPMTITELGQFDPGENRGTYTLSIVRADDNVIVATATLEMSLGSPDSLGFKYARLSQPVRLEAGSKPVVIYPRGLSPSATYDVRAIHPGLRVQQTGAKLMAEGISLEKVLPGELLFLNLANFPGSGTDKVAPAAPSNVVKRLATNLGVQGVELSWSASHDDNWLSYYEVHRNGVAIGRSAIGTFFFDHSKTDVGANYDVVAIDGDGNRSPATSAKQSADGPQIFEALGGFSPSQSANQWRYEEALGEGAFRELLWDKGGYEGRWTGSGLGTIGRIWMQPAAQYDLSRTFVVPATGTVSLSGEIRKDPSAENQYSSFVRILRNSEQLWPKAGWAEVKPQYDSATSYDLSNLIVNSGDKLRFEVKHNDDNRADPIVWNPRVVLSE